MAGIKSVFTCPVCAETGVRSDRFAHHMTNKQHIKWFNANMSAEDKTRYGQLCVKRGADGKVIAAACPSCRERPFIANAKMKDSEVEFRNWSETHLILCYSAPAPTAVDLSGARVSTSTGAGRAPTIPEETLSKLIEAQNLDEGETPPSLQTMIDNVLNSLRRTRALVAKRSNDLAAAEETIKELKDRIKSKDSDIYNLRLIMRGKLDIDAPAKDSDEC
jgi:hypothetical protein